MLKTCPICGSVYHAKRKDSKYCSTRCRVAAHRGAVPIEPDRPPIIPSTGGMVEDLALLNAECRALADSYTQLSRTAPLQLRAGCARVGAAISAAMDGEGW